MPNPLISLDLSYACRLHVLRAQRAFPELPIIAALVAEAERNRGGLSASAVGVYTHDHRLIARRLVEEGLVTEREGRVALDRIVPALARRYDAALPRRTSGKKSTALTAIELKAVFDALKSEGLSKNNIWVALVGLLVVSLVVLGARPMEMTTLERSGSYLRVQTAKRSHRADPYRVYDARRVPESWIAAMVMVAEICGQENEVDSFYRLLRHLSQILGRISEAVIGRRICCYTLRHVSLATWKRAGISAHDIALLAGHISVRTARHYAPARSGHAGVVVIRPVAPDLVPEGLFAEKAQSPLMRPPRGPRRPNWSIRADAAEAILIGSRKVGSADPSVGAVADAVSETAYREDAESINGQSFLNMRSEPATTAESPALQEKAAAVSLEDAPIPNTNSAAWSPDSGLSRAAQERAYRLAWLQRGVRIVGPVNLDPHFKDRSNPKSDADGFDFSDMPIPEPIPPQRPSLAVTRRAPPLRTDANSALDNLLADMSEPGSGDLVLPDHLVMPLPHGNDEMADPDPGTGEYPSRPDRSSTKPDEHPDPCSDRPGRHPGQF